MICPRDTHILLRQRITWRKKTTLRPNYAYAELLLYRERYMQLDLGGQKGKFNT